LQSLSLALILSTGMPWAPALAQAPDASLVVCTSSTSLADLLEEGRRLASLEQNGAARPCFEHAVKQAVAASDSAAEALARLGLARAARHLSDYTTAAAEALQARELFAASGDRLQGARADEVLAYVAIEKPDPHEARGYYEAALAVYTAFGADADRASTLINITYTLPAGDPEKPRLLEEAMVIARSLASPGLEARILHVRADHHFNAGRFDAAVVDLNLAIAKFKEADRPTSLADAYVSLGRLYRAHGQPARAIEYYDLAADLQERSGELRGLVQSINAKAIALGILGQIPESREAYERALALALKTGSARIINFQQGNLAAAYAASGDRAGAIRLLEEVITRETDPYLLAYRHGNLAGNYLLEQRPALALRHADRSIEYGLRVGNRDYVARLYYQRATVHRALGRIDRALEDAREGVKIVEELRGRLVPLDFMKRGFSELHQSIFGLTVALTHQRGEPEGALIASEQARARAFLDLLASRETSQPSPSPGPSPVVGKAVIPTPSDSEGSTGVTVRGGGEGVVPLTEGAELSLASYASATTASVAEIAATATRLQTTLLAYWVNDEETYAWVVRPGRRIRSVRIAITRAALERMALAAVPKPDASETTPFRRLYAAIVAPVSEWLPAPGGSLTILPHGPLFRVSFAALMDTRGKYLIERYAIGYGPSASVFAFTDRLAQRARTRSSSGSLIIADPRPLPVSPNQEPLPALSAAMTEASAIRSVLGPDRTTVLTRADALESDVRRELPGKLVVHFATHGVIRDDEPLDSYLALGGTGDEPSSDGRLTVREMYDLSLSSDIVILSACRTATGRASGDGIAGTARALFYAGTPTVVATLWDVADQPSAALMKGFYKHWSGGRDKRAALRHAQLDLLRQLRAGGLVVRSPAGNVRLDARPFYWAGYVLIGEPF
jgi:CHAT domain-containing protein/tetratricopeptide (TPR) repeat protein